MPARKLARTLLCIVPVLFVLPLQAQELQVAELGSCTLDSGAVLAPCDLGYRTYGELNAAGDNAILIGTWFGGNSAAWTGLLPCCAHGGSCDTSTFWRRAEAAAEAASRSAAEAVAALEVRPCDRLRQLQRARLRTAPA